MRTTPTFLLEQRKKKQETQFACYLRNVTPHALSLSVPFGTLEAQATMNPAAYGRLQEQNRTRVSVSGIADETYKDNPSSMTAAQTPQPIPERVAASVAQAEDDWDG